jgi:hypothetical protein
MTEEDRTLAVWVNLLVGTSLRHQAKIYDYATLRRYSVMYQRFIGDDAR